jgi:hypothetical protein
MQQNPRGLPAPGHNQEPPVVLGCWPGGKARTTTKSAGTPGGVGPFSRRRLRVGNACNNIAGCLVRGQRLRTAPLPCIGCSAACGWDIRRDVPCRSGTSRHRIRVSSRGGSPPNSPGVIFPVAPEGKCLVEVRGAAGFGCATSACCDSEFTGQMNIFLRCVGTARRGRDPVCLPIAFHAHSRLGP